MSIKKNVWVLIGFFTILGILLRVLDGPILTPSIQSLYLSGKIDTQQVLYLRVGAAILLTILGTILFFKFCKLHFEWKDLVYAASILAGYTCLMILLIQVFRDGFVLDYKIWLLYTPVEGFMSLTYLLSGHGQHTVAFLFAKHLSSLCNIAVRNQTAKTGYLILGSKKVSSKI